MKRLLFIMAFAVAASAESRAACTGVIDSATATISGRQYDPFSANAFADRQTVRVTSRASNACDFALVFSAPPGPRRLSGVLSYALTDLNGRTLLLPDPPTMPPAYSLSASRIAANASVELPFLVTMERGQFAAPGRFSDTVTIQLFSVEDGRFQLQDTKPLSLAYTVPQFLSVTVGKADAGWAMQFGELAEGAQKSVSLLARSNVSYRFNVTSDNRGALLLDPPVNGQMWSVPYVVAVDNRAVDLSAPAGSFTVLAAPTPIAGDNHALGVTIGNVSGKRAGLYRDVITVQISASQLY